MPTLTTLINNLTNQRFSILEHALMRIKETKDE